VLLVCSGTSLNVAPYGLFSYLPRELSEEEVLLKSEVSDMKLVKRARADELKHAAWLYDNEEIEHDEFEVIKHRYASSRGCRRNMFRSSNILFPLSSLTCRIKATLLECKPLFDRIEVDVKHAKELRTDAEILAVALKEERQTHSRSKSGFFGVRATNEERTCWTVCIQFEAKSHYIGSFASKEEGAWAYNRAARSGEYGTDHKLNLNCDEPDSEDEGEDEHYEEEKRPDASEYDPPVVVLEEDESEDEGEDEHYEEEKRPDASKYDGDRAGAFARYSAAHRRREKVGDDYDDIVAAHERPSAGIPGVRWI
jgi:hypothetical protein